VNTEYIETTEEQLLGLRDSLDLLEQLNRDKIRELDIYLYGTTTDRGLVDAAKEAIADSSYEVEITEEDVNLTEIAVAIPISGDTIYALTGSGFRVDRHISFAYQSEGEGPRDLNYGASSYRPNISFSVLKNPALADSDLNLGEYLKQYGTGGAAQIKPKVRRTEEATQPGIPAPAQAPETPAQAPPATPAPAPQGQPKRTSVNIPYLVEKFLG